eukprot:5155502-Pyramimonas_sp.AAC.1
MFCPIRCMSTSADSARRFRSGIIILSIVSCSPRSVEVSLHQKSDVDTRERKSFKRARIGAPRQQSK